VKARNLFVIRRLSGGGAVYHDLGNLNFTFIVRQQEGSNVLDFRKFTEPIIRALRHLGVQAKFNSRNDLSIDGKKFSGNAQFIQKGKCLHHGTLLFNTNLDDLEKALRVSNDKIESKGIKSIRGRVTNILPHTTHPVSIENFKQLLINEFIEQGENIQYYRLTMNDQQKIEELANNRYRTWEWNYGESPFFTIKKKSCFEFGKIEAWLDIDQGIIKTCKFYGDFFGRDDKSDIEEMLVGCRYEEKFLTVQLKEIKIENYFYGLTVNQFLQFLVG
jgi:lipoate-protein ligase A